MKTYYRRNLPHIQPQGATFFVTFRLFGSLPKRILQNIKNEYKDLNQLILKEWNQKSKGFMKYYNQQKRLFKKFDDYLHSTKIGPHYLKIESIAELVYSSIMYLDEEKYDLLAFCIMSNHVHVVFTPIKINEEEYVEMAEIMHSIKSYTASKANQLLNKTGRKFWASESFDHYCRGEAEIERVVDYVLNNPVYAGLVSSYEQWWWSYVNSELYS